VEEVRDQGFLSQRLLEMGIIRGTTIEVIRFAPMGDPIDIKIRGYHLSLRREEAEGIILSVSDEISEIERF
jgi:Fe2+ transport system protein FeoA